MFKVVLLGEGRVGKTSMIKQIMKKKFTDHEISTTQASHCLKTLSINNQSVTLDIWDTAGQEQYHALGPVYYRDADAAILVFDVTLPDTFTMVKSWAREIASTCEKDIAYVIAGNKIDLVSTSGMQEASQFARSLQGEYIETSAKTGRNLDLLLQTVARILLAKRKDAFASDPYAMTSALLAPGEADGMTVKPITKKKCCC